MPFTPAPIQFGTDGWRGVIAADFTFARVCHLAPIAAQVLSESYSHLAENRLVIVGYDRRFLAEQFAQAAAEAVQAAGFDVYLANTYAPTPALSWAVKANSALGALVLTASHNPAEYLGLKVKGAFGGSVTRELTAKIESRLLSSETPSTETQGELERFNPWDSYAQVLASKVDLDRIQDAIKQGKLGIFADVMHGAAAGGLSRFLGEGVIEINGDRDPLFGGNPPEPLPAYIPDLFRAINQAKQRNQYPLRVGLVFDGDSDRVAAVDGEGNFLSSQVLIPILIQHLVQHHGFSGEVVKTVSGSDLIPLIAQQYQQPLYETPIGYKYIAERMLETPVLVGGEESGGIGYGTHIPERDALLSALYAIEAVVVAEKDLGRLYQDLQAQVRFSSAYDRIDLPLANEEAKQRVQTMLDADPPNQIAERTVTSCQTVDGYKFRLEDNSWLLVRFSGTEPLLRLYCEATDQPSVRTILNWAKQWASSL
ncbi:phosphoglucomutase/phosphomannomutase alpha/beta/alpha domain I [Halothece sp. PCC 7418]|uniref:phosphoglucomutase/phosphomannomutase family protein n=1 Tax=Halothece sp. (strain PCC 7418) TaxID=65093 RepID=UPI0002A06DAE|nr:phosphoglucomutase/phosphomannomutase family protein [Halothece sp. PCC 7418]AFZ44847.1 phosphoglucomutase/phosphomannomutase alpha/beta/alpha domain I [Halothece sp. PCC 7418]